MSWITRLLNREDTKIPMLEAVHLTEFKDNEWTVEYCGWYFDNCAHTYGEIDGIVQYCFLPREKAVELASKIAFINKTNVITSVKVSK